MLIAVVFFLGFDGRCGALSSGGWIEALRLSSSVSGNKGVDVEYIMSGGERYIYCLGRCFSVVLEAALCD
jgi:hypothetical protein